MGTAIRSASGARKEAGDVARAKETAKKVNADLAALEEATRKDIDAIDATYDAQAEELSEVQVKAKATDIAIPVVGLLWMPFRKAESGRLESA